MNNKKILFYFPLLYPCTFGGLEIFNFYLVSSLIKTNKDIDIQVFTSCARLQQENSKNYLPLKDKLFRTTRNGLGAVSTFINYLISKNFKWRDIETIYIPYTSNFNYNVIAFLLIYQFFKIPYVIHIHGGAMRPWKPVWLQKMFFKKAKNIAGVSWPIVNEYSKRSNRKVEYLPPILPFKNSTRNPELLKAENNLNKFDTIILYVGSLKPLKAPDTLINAVCSLGIDFLTENKIGVVILGDGSLKEELQIIVKNNNCEDHFCFMGRVKNEDVADFYSIANIFVIPSWFEGTPIVLLEAMFNSLICVGSNVSGINTIIEDKKNGLLFEKDDFQKLSKLLKGIVHDFDSYKTLALKAKSEFDQKYSFDKNVAKILSFIKEQ